MIAAQSETQALLKSAQRVQNTYSEMLFWYFDGSVTQYYESLNKAGVAADKLEALLTSLAMDPEAAQQIVPMLDNLADYRGTMDSAIRFYQQGRNNMAASEISSAHIIVQDMNAQLLALTSLFQGRLSADNFEVENALDKTLSVSFEVMEGSNASMLRIEEVTGFALLLIVITVPCSVVIALLIIVSITTPLKNLRRQLLLIDHQSDLTQPLNLEGKDEIREMSEATKSLLTRLRVTLTEVDAMASQLKSTADDSYKVSTETHAQSSEQQLQSEGIASAAAQLGASAEDISRTTQEGLGFVDKVRNAAEKGQTDVQATATSMGQIADQFNQVETTVKDLIARSDSIEQVLNVIQGIAEQTNLLALNAAIEAARAGDQGRGFAVVADEVRTLSKRTSESTNQIQQMVESLQQQSRNAITSLDQNRQQVDLGVELSSQAENSLSIVQQELQTLITMNESIAIITDEQQQAVLSVDESVQKVRDLARNVEEKAASSKIANADLNTLAQTLQNQLLAFRH